LFLREHNISLRTVKLTHRIQIICATFVAILFIFSLVFAKFVKTKALAMGEGANALYKELSNLDTQSSLPGAQAMQRARQLLEAGDYNGAREKLLFVTNFYSGASFASHARQILGEMNLDQLFSPTHSKYKTIYQVQRGDALASIAKKHKCTIEFLMALNGLKYSTRIQPGQELFVMPLEFKTVINIQQKKLTLFKGEQFIKDYPILDTIISSRKKYLTTRIDRMLAYNNTSTYPKSSKKYLQNKKMAILKAGNLQIRSVRHPNEPAPGAGIFLSASDMEEYALLVKSGGRVEIQL